MPSLLQNKYVRFAGIGILLLVGLAIFWGVSNLFSSNTGLNGTSFDSGYAPSVSKSYPASEGVMQDERSIAYSPDYHPPQPNTGSYTADLETYETTSYSITGRIKQFDDLCSTLKNLKTDSQIHFKQLNESTNNCNASFYAEEDRAEGVLSTLSVFKGVEYTRNTSSVTRHRQQIQSQTSIFQQQLDNVQKSLTTAETQLDNLTKFYLNSDDVATLSKRVNESLALIDQLTQRKINLTSQLNNLYQQSSDLEARMGVVEFSVNINRSNPIYAEEDSRKWEQAWDELSDTYTATLIGLSAFFGIFLLWTLRIAIYAAVLLLVARGLWKLIKKLWSIG